MHGSIPVPDKTAAGATAPATAEAIARAKATALTADRCMAWDELGLLTAPEREAYWHKRIHRPPSPPLSGVFFDFNKDDIDRDYAHVDSRRSYEHGE